MALAYSLTGLSLQTLVNEIQPAAWANTVGDVIYEVGFAPSRLGFAPSSVCNGIHPGGRPCALRLVDFERLLFRGGGGGSA